MTSGLWMLNQGGKTDRRACCCDSATLAASHNDKEVIDGRTTRQRLQTAFQPRQHYYLIDEKLKSA